MAGWLVTATVLGIAMLLAAGVCLRDWLRYRAELRAAELDLAIRKAVLDMQHAQAMYHLGRDRDQAERVRRT